MATKSLVAKPGSKWLKTKWPPPFRQAEFDILYNEGISREGEIIELGVIHNFVDKAGSWFSYQGQKIGQGKDNARTFLREHPEIAAEIEGKLREKLLVKLPTAKVEEVEIEEVAG